MHLTVPQLIRDNVLTADEVSSPQIVHCARLVGLKAKEVQLDWDGLAHLKKALPVIARLKSGQCMVVLRVEGDGEGDTLRVILQDPNAHEDAPLVIDRVRFEEAWTGDIILVKRNYDIADETQPFSIRFIAALIFRERWIVRDVAICALVLGFLSLTPILFWRVLSDKVIYYKAFDTFYVICVVMLVFIVFETAFGWLRQFLVLFMTSRVDAKISTYVFAKVMNLPMDFFERTQVGKIAYDMNQVFRIRTFPGGAIVRDDSRFDHAVVLHSGDVVLQSNDDGRCRWSRCADCGLADRMAAGLPAKIERGRGGGIGKRRVSGAEPVRRPHG